MTIVLAAIGVALGAFGIWLSVRIVNRERWARWTALGLAVALPVLYLLSSGPAVWVISNRIVSDSVAEEIVRLYDPLGWLDRNGPQAIGDGLDWYINLWLAPIQSD